MPIQNHSMLLKLIVQTNKRIKTYQKHFRNQLKRNLTDKYDDCVFWARTLYCDFLCVSVLFQGIGYLQALLFFQPIPPCSNINVCILILMFLVCIIGLVYLNMENPRAPISQHAFYSVIIHVKHCGARGFRTYSRNKYEWMKSSSHKYITYEDSNWAHLYT